MYDYSLFIYFVDCNNWFVLLQKTIFDQHQSFVTSNMYTTDPNCTLTRVFERKFVYAAHAFNFFGLIWLLFFLMGVCKNFQCLNLGLIWKKMNFTLFRLCYIVWCLCHILLDFQKRRCSIFCSFKCLWTLNVTWNNF